MRIIALSAATLAIALTAAGCGGGSVSAQQSTADAATKAVYNGDVNGMQAQFDPALQKQVTLDGVAALSHRCDRFRAGDRGGQDYNAGGVCAAICGAGGSVG